MQRAEIDLGFSRVEPQPDVTYKVIAHEPILVILPRDHPLAVRTAIDPRDLDPASFIGYPDTPHVLRGIVGRYLHDHGIAVSPSHFLDGFATGISLVASTGGVTLLPTYVEPQLPWSVVNRPLTGNPPVIEIAAGYRADNPSLVLESFLKNIDQLIAAHAAVSRQFRPEAWAGRAPRARSLAVLIANLGSLPVLPLGVRIEGLACGIDLVEMVERPGVQRLERRLQRSAERRDLILYGHGGKRQDVACDEAVAFASSPWTDPAADDVGGYEDEEI